MSQTPESREQPRKTARQRDSQLSLGGKCGLENQWPNGEGLMNPELSSGSDSLELGHVAADSSISAPLSHV